MCFVGNTIICIWAIFYTGILNGYGLSPETFAKGFYDVLLLNISIIVLSFSEVHNDGNYNWPLLFSQFVLWGQFSLVFFCGLLVVMARLTPPTEPIGMKSRSFSKSKNIKNYNKQCADYKAYNIIFLICKFVVIWFLVILSMLIPASAITYGEELAKKEIASRSKVTCDGQSEIYKIFSLENQPITKGFYIISSGSSIAIWTGHQSEIFPLSEVKVQVEVCGAGLEKSKVSASSSK